MSTMGTFATAFWQLVLIAPVLLVGLALERLCAGRKGPPYSTDVEAPPNVDISVPMPGIGHVPASVPPPNPPSLRWGTFWALASGLLAGIGGVLLMTSATHDQVAVTSTLASLSIVFTPLLGRWILSERLPATFYVGSATTLVGAILVVLGKMESGSTTSSSQPITSQLWTLIADAQALLAALFMSISCIFLKKARYHVSTSTVLLVGTSASFVLTCLGAFFVEHGEILPDSHDQLVILLVFALVCGGVPQLLVTWAMRHVTASLASVTSSLSSTSSLVLAWVFLGETLGALQLVGVFLGVLGVILAEASGHPAFTRAVMQPVRAIRMRTKAGRAREVARVAEWLPEGEGMSFPMLTTSVKS